LATCWPQAIRSGEARPPFSFFLRFGLQPEAWQDLQIALIGHARDNPIAETDETAFGTKYLIDGPLLAADGRSPLVRAVWFVEAGEEQPRFVTAYPLEGGAP
jgi:hypothetical protein